MKRLASSDSLGGFISVCPSSEEKGSSHVYRRGFQSMLDGLDDADSVEESGQISEKKRRLSVDQVKALERNFEVENKLEPERKVKLAQDLGLQPRQVAVWFQNRRARWKTKQLERDYSVLKANYDSLKLNFEALRQDKEALLAEMKELKAKTQEENTESNVLAAKEEILISESVENRVVTEQSQISMAAAGLGGSETTEPNQDCNNNTAYGSSDSDSSAILNEDNSSNAAISSSGVFQQQQLLMSPAPSSLRFNCSSTTSSPSPTSLNCFQFSDTRLVSKNPQKAAAAYQQPQFVKMEEHNFFSADEHCNFFSEDQAPTLHWYCLDQWN